MPKSIQNLINYFDKDIWRIPAKKLSPRHSFYIKQLRVIILAIREFRGNQRQLNASALTFYTLISIVPVAAMAFGIAKGFGLDKALEVQILQKFPGHETTINQIILFASNLLKDTKGSLVAGIGVGVLFWTVIKVLNDIETSFNDIWGVKKGRSFGRKITDYLSIMLICPFLVILSGSATVFLTHQIEFVVTKLSFLGHFTFIILCLLPFLPYIMIAGLFTFLYIFMPNTRVNVISGMIGGLIAGTIYQIVQFFYIHFQVGVAKTNVIYGGFAALPLFLLWLQISWLIVLFGAEVAFAHQNVDTYEFEHDCLNVTPAHKRLLALRIAACIVKRFEKGEPPLESHEITDMLDIPVRLVQGVLFDLSEAGVLSELRDAQGKVFAFQPAVDIHKLTIHSVLKALDQRGEDNVPIVENRELSHLKDSLKGFDELIRRSSYNKLLKDV